MSNESLSQDIDQDKVPQDRVGTIVLMFAWAAVWFTLLIYVVGQQFIPVGGTKPTWLRLLITVLGTGKGTSSLGAPPGILRPPAAVEMKKAGRFAFPRWT